MAGGLFRVVLSVCLAALQPAVYIYIQRYHPVGARTWCTRDWVKEDCLSLTPDGKRVEKTNGTDLKIILPSYGQTGTTSLTTALRELGIRAWHADDYSVFQKSLMWDNNNHGLWSRGVTRCRMEAVSLEPVTDVLPMALRMSPKAKFILTWRSFPSWHKSTTSTRTKEVRWGIIHETLQRGNRWLPWVETWDYFFGNIRRMRQDGQVFPTDNPIAAYIYRTECNGYAWAVTNFKDRGTFQSKAHEESYLGHQNEIRMLVPKHRLMEFDVKKHGWAELEEFLGYDTGRVGTPFPHPRTSDHRTNEVVMESNFKNTRWALLFFTVLHVLNLFLIAAAMRLSIALLWLLAWAVGLVDWPLEGAAERSAAALAACPLVAVLEGVRPEAAAPLGEALVAAGVRALAVPLEAPGAEESLQRLVAAMPADVAVGGCLAAEGPSGAQAVYDARGHFVLSTFTSRAVLRSAQGLGLASLSGASTPSEAASASCAGAAGLVVLPELVSPARLRACRDCLPSGTHILAWGLVEPQALEEYWAAGVRSIAVGGASLFHLGEPSAETTARAAALLSACRAAQRSAVARHS